MISRRASNFKDFKEVAHELDRVYRYIGKANTESIVRTNNTGVYGGGGDSKETENNITTKEQRFILQVSSMVELPTTDYTFMTQQYGNVTDTMVLLKSFTSIDKIIVYTMATNGTNSYKYMDELLLKQENVVRGPEYTCLDFSIKYDSERQFWLKIREYEPIMATGLISFSKETTYKGTHDGIDAPTYTYYTNGELTVFIIVSLHVTI